MQAGVGRIAAEPDVRWGGRPRADELSKGADRRVGDGQAGDVAPWHPPIVVWGILGAASWLPIALCLYLLLP